MIAFWLALGVLVAALVAGGAYLGVRAFQTIRALKGLRAAMRPELERMAGARKRTASELEAASKAFERLEKSLVRMRTARARIRLLRSVVSEIEALAARVRAFVPSKKPV